QTQSLAQCLAIGVGGAEDTCLLQAWHYVVDDHGQIYGIDGRPQPHAVDAVSLPPQQQIAEFGWGAVEYQCVRAWVGVSVEGDVDVGVSLEVGGARLCDLGE